MLKMASTICVISSLKRIPKKRTLNWFQPSNLSFVIVPSLSKSYSLNAPVSLLGELQILMTYTQACPPDFLVT